ncbi:hypothetical protein HOP50_07g49060 [Chloropicon primus]|uniref:Uncharacterized protein n=1 Tax=Chloropicon primus TaxID=1764295 RepID=A0A5B8MPL3_9CHLO|nr:hypothetical protein A3770_07p48850 [Chloropicon primus]UPR01584.1 hypothetical protein HOP50_07g49060 [Chloropicon primus]|eukprot:QDZ22367.1 hypothetical protein A3770_07p48850 [Chloropicon primus]
MSSTSNGRGGQVRFTTYSHRAVYDPNNPSASCEYESFSRGIREGEPGPASGQGRGKVIISETHRTYSDLAGYERLGLARTPCFVDLSATCQLGEQGQSVTRERFASGEERTSQSFASLDASNASAFDRSWQEHAASRGLDRIQFLKGSSATREQIQQQQRRGRAVQSEEEREIARRGREMFNQHTERIVRQARELGGTARTSRASARQGQTQTGSRGLPAASNAGGQSQDERQAREWARQEAQRFWS